MGRDLTVQVDYLIVGQGLAGSLLALNLLKIGKTVLVVDDGHKHAASKVAAGLINPITGRRHVLTWRFMEFWKFLQDDYSYWEGFLNSKFLHRKPILRFLKTEEEHQVFKEKLDAGMYEGIDLSYHPEAHQAANYKPNEPYYELKQTGYVDQSCFIKCVRKHLESIDSIETAKWKAPEFTRENGGVRWKQFEASTIIFTQGFQNDKNPYFRDLPFRHAKGEILELSSDLSDDSPVLNRGKWLMPIGSGRFRAGATYDLKHIDHEATDTAVSEIMTGVTAMVENSFEVVGSQAGIRPALHDFKPVLGRNPWHPELVIFNGLGSKGSLQAPLLAKELVDHLEEGKPLHAEADVERFRKYL